MCFFLQRVSYEYHQCRVLPCGDTWVNHLLVADRVEMYTVEKVLDLVEFPFSWKREGCVHTSQLLCCFCQFLWFQHHIMLVPILGSQELCTSDAGRYSTIAQLLSPTEIVLGIIFTEPEAFTWNHKGERAPQFLKQHPNTSNWHSRLTVTSQRPWSSNGRTSSFLMELFKINEFFLCSPKELPFYLGFSLYSNLLVFFMVSLVSHSITVLKNIIPEFRRSMLDSWIASLWLCDLRKNTNFSEL